MDCKVGFPFCLLGKSLIARHSRRYMSDSSMSAFARAMGGSVPFEEALAARLSLFKPSLAHVQDFLEKRPPR